MFPRCVFDCKGFTTSDFCLHQMVKHKQDYIAVFLSSAVQLLHCKMLSDTRRISLMSLVRWCGSTITLTWARHYTLVLDCKKNRTKESFISGHAHRIQEYSRMILSYPKKIPSFQLWNKFSKITVFICISWTTRVVINFRKARLLNSNNYRCPCWGKKVNSLLYIENTICRTQNKDKKSLCLWPCMSLVQKSSLNFCWIMIHF